MMRPRCVSLALAGFGLPMETDVANNGGEPR